MRLGGATQTCSRCVMDTSAPGITFDGNGVCNFCTEFLQKSGEVISGARESNSDALQQFIDNVKERGKRHRYDCIVGVSGGVDSSWVLVKAVEFGLRPLAVHMDNGWNSELAQNNIANLIQGLSVNLYTYVIDWVEYRRLMQAFFDADVVDVELLYDNAMLAVNYRQAARFSVKSILAGTNQATEGMRMPASWNHLKFDRRNIRSIAKKFGSVKIRSFPAIGTAGFILHEFIMGVRWHSFLDLMPYRKNEALKTLTSDFGYKPYPYKHYESVFTRFYQGYILPKKFGIDKRKLHLSTLVVAGEMTREEALTDLEGAPYPSETELARDIEYFLKKMRWTRADLDEYIRRPGKSHQSYGSEKPLYDFCGNVYGRLGNRSR